MWFGVIAKKRDKCFFYSTVSFKNNSYKICIVSFNVSKYDTAVYFVQNHIYNAFKLYIYLILAIQKLLYTKSIATWLESKTNYRGSSILGISKDQKPAWELQNRLSHTWHLPRLGLFFDITLNGYFLSYFAILECPHYFMTLDMKTILTSSVFLKVEIFVKVVCCLAGNKL